MSEGTPSAPLALSGEDRERIHEVERLARRGPGSVGALVEHLSERSWAVRRAVVGALARLGAPAVDALCEVLRGRRDDEGRLAAAVDALVASEAPAEAAVATLLEHPNPAVVYDAAQVLGRRRSAGAVPLLATLIRHPDDNVAVAAIEALGRIGGGAAVDALVAASESGSFFRTFPAIDVLGRSGDPSVVPALVRLLDDPLYAPEAARALGRTGEERAVAPLVGLLSRPSDALVRLSAVALVEIHDAHLERYGGTEAVRAALRTTAGLGRRLTRVLPGADESERVALARLLGWMGGDEAVASLIELLDAEPAVARVATEALGEVGREAHAQLLAALREGDSARRRALLPLLGRQQASAADVARCLEDPDAGVRAAACEALGRLGDASAVEPLFARLTDPDARVAQAALSAIQSLGSARTEALALAAARSDDVRLRRAALRIIAYFGYASGLEVLLSALDAPDERLRDAAIYGLPFIEDPRALDALVAASAHPAERTRAAAMRALGQAPKEPRVTSALLGGLGDRDAWVRYYACQSLARLNDQAAADAIVALVDDEAGQVRVAVVDALAHLNTEGALHALRRAARSDDPDVQRAALLGLGITKRSDSLPALLAALESAEAATRLVALSAVAEFEAPEALPALVRAAHDRDEGVRNAAVGFLAARPGPEPAAHLIALLSEPRVRERALSALALPREGRLPALLAALDGADDALAPLLVAALARMHRADATAAIFDALESAGPAGRRAAAHALGAFGTPRSREALERASRHDPDPDVRRVCELALAR